MNLRFRLIGAAKTEYDARGNGDTSLAGPHMDAFAIQAGDFVTHPLFPDRDLVCSFRRIDLIAREVVLYVDLSESPPKSSSSGDNVVPLRPA